MKTSLDELSNLPAAKRAELELVKDIIVEQFAASDREFIVLEKIILFGSYARGRQVEDRYVQNGTTYEYRSDFDILTVSQKPLTDEHWLQLNIDDLVDNHPHIGTDVNIIHHDIGFLNKKLKENRYFFVDILTEGVLLYDSGRCELAQPGTLTPSELGEKAQEEFEHWLKKGDISVKGFRFYLNDKEYNEAAFNLHQATERYYSAILLVFTDYKPRWHNLKKIGKQVAGVNAKFKEVFPCSNKEEKRLFQLLKSAYVDARYKKGYTITAEELNYLVERIQLLRELAIQYCQKEIARLKAA